MRKIIGIIATALTLLVTGLIAPTAQAAPKAIESSSGITYLDSRQVTARTLEIDIASLAIGPHVYKGKLQMRVVLPTGYHDPANAGRRYPVQYLLHGQGGRSSDWTSGSKVEQLTANTDVILVTPEGGKGGWYTNWVNQDQGKQDLERFHTQQVIGFIDHNFRTIASKAGRAISGFSMGGFGAIHYAGRHPELFAYTSSFSGGLDLEDQAIRVAVLGSAGINELYPLDGAFGPVIWPMDTIWKQHNPLRMAANYRSLQVGLYSGQGLDVYELGANHSTWNFHRALTRAGVRHVANLYGNPGTLNGEPCRGDHSWSCVDGAYKEDLPRMVAALARA